MRTLGRLAQALGSERRHVPAGGDALEMDVVAGVLDVVLARLVHLRDHLACGEPINDP